MSSKAIKAKNLKQNGTPVIIQNIEESPQLSRIMSTDYDVENAVEKSTRGRKSKLTPKVKKEIISMLVEGYPFPYILNKFGISCESWCHYEEVARSGRNKAMTEFFSEIKKLKDPQVLKQWEKVVSSDNPQLTRFSLEVLDKKTFAPQPKPSYNPQPSQHLHLHFRDGEIARKFSSLLARGATQEEF